MQRLQHVIVSGAGPAGLAASFMLNKAGIPVTLLERVEKSQLLSDVGGAYDLYPNTLKILQHLNVADNLRAKSSTFNDIKFFNSKCELLRNLPAHVLKDGEESCSSLRSIIQFSFLDEIINDIDIKYSTKVIDFEENANGTVTVMCDNNEKYECDLLISADGVFSKIAQNLMQKNNETAPTNFCNVQAFWGRYPGQWAANTAYFYMAPGKSFAGGNVQSTEGYPFFVWTAMLHTNTMKHFATDSERKQYVFDQMTQCFKSDEIANVIYETKEEDVLDVGIYDRDQLNSWSNKSKNVVLAGDSAHPMTPFLGQGCNTAITDTFIFCKLLERYQYDVRKLSDIINEYETNRMETVYSKIVYPSRKMAQRTMSTSSLMQLAFQTFLRFAPEQRLAVVMKNSTKVNDISDFL